MANRDQVFHDSFAGDYDRVVVNPREFPNHVLFAPFAAGVGSGEAMLDIGCGTGHMLVRYGRQFRRRVGVDHSAGMMDVARRNVAAAGITGTQFVQGDIVQFADDCRDTFDFVSCVGVLHHLTADQRRHLLGRIPALLRPGGRVVLAEPVEVDLAAMPAAVREWGSRSLGARIEFVVTEEEPEEAPIDEREWRDTLAASGFVIERERRMWEMSSRTPRPGLIEQLQIRWLIHRHGANGNILAMLLRV